MGSVLFCDLSFRNDFQMDENQEILVIKEEFEEIVDSEDESNIVEAKNDVDEESLNDLDYDLVHVGNKSAFEPRSFQDFLKTAQQTLPSASTWLDQSQPIMNKVKIKFPKVNMAHLAISLSKITFF